MKEPLQALLISPDFKSRVSILTGMQTATIREGHRDYRAGTVMLCCHIVPWAVMAQIKNVRHVTLREVTKEEWEAAGFNSQDEMLTGLRCYYLDMTLDSPVTFIQWDSGSLIGLLKQHSTDYHLHPEKFYSNIVHKS